MSDLCSKIGIYRWVARYRHVTGGSNVPYSADLADPSPHYVLRTNLCGWRTKSSEVMYAYYTRVVQRCALIRTPAVSILSENPHGTQQNVRLFLSTCDFAET